MFNGKPAVILKAKNRSENTFNNKGRHIGKGCEKHRLILSESVGGIAAEILHGKPGKGKKLVDSVTSFLSPNIKLQVRDDDKLVTIAINVNSLAKRCFVSKKEIMEAVKRDDIYNFIQEQAEKVEKVFLQRKIMNDKGICNEELKTVFRDVDKCKESSVLKTDKRYVYLIKEKGVSNIKLILFEDLLGKGGYGEVFGAHVLDDFSSGEGQVLKRARNVRGANEDIINEYNVLKELNQDGLIPGLQKPHKKIICLGKSHGGSELVGCLAHRYACDLSKLMKEEVENKNKPNYDQRMQNFRELAEGLLHCHEHKFVITDIKPQNILVSFLGGVACLCFSDFGGAHKIDKDSGGTKIVYTPCYTAHNDDIKAQREKYLGIINRFEELIRAKDEMELTHEEEKELEEGKEEYEQTLVEYFNLMAQQDIFSFGITMTERLTGKIYFREGIFRNYVNGYPDIDVTEEEYNQGIAPDRLFQDNLFVGLSEDIKNLFKKNDAS